MTDAQIRHLVEEKIRLEFRLIPELKARVGHINEMLRAEVLDLGEEMPTVTNV